MRCKPLDTIRARANVEIRLVDKKGRTVEKRVGHNIWTYTGREYLAQLMTYLHYSDPLPVPVEYIRNDRVCYMGVGIGYSDEVASVARLADAVAYDVAGGDFLKPLTEDPEWPLSPTRTTVRYICSFETTDLVYAPMDITEVGLFTDGDPRLDWDTRLDLTLGTTSLDAPVAYHSFDPIPKTPDFRLTVKWEIRF